MDKRGDKNASEDQSQRTAGSRPARWDDTPLTAGGDQARACGAVLADRRTMELHLTTRAAAETAGVVHSTISAFESGRNVPRPTRFAGLDRAYRYADGSVERLYRFGELPAPIEGSPAPRVPTKEFSVPLPLQSLIDLVQVDQALRDKIQERGDPELGELRMELGRSVDRLLRAWMLAQVEGRRAEGASDDPFVATLLAMQLAQRPLAEDEHDRDELIYLRWLLRQPLDLTTEDEARYAEKFATRTQGR